MAAMTKCPIDFNELKLIWRPALHTSRCVVGTLRREADGYAFVYDGPDLSCAIEEGFSGYPGMGDFDRIYNGQAMATFASRLPDRDRADFLRLIAAWDGEADMSDFELLGLTNGRLPTDMFELIPVIEPRPGVSFVSDLAGMSNYAGSEAFRSLAEGTELELVPNPENEFDPCAVEVRYAEQRVAHVKRVHCDSVSRAFQEGLRVTCSLVRVRANGVVQQVVVRIRYDKGHGTDDT